MIGCFRLKLEKLSKEASRRLLSLATLSILFAKTVPPSGAILAGIA
jgi:hypothetical protein